MVKSFKKGCLLIAALIASLSLFCAFGNQQAASAKEVKGKIKVLSSVDFYGEVAKAVLGNQGTVENVIKKTSIDPHDYQPTTNVAKQADAADVLLYNGIGYDSWMSKLAQNNKRALAIRVGENIMDRKNGDNPHLWYNRKTMPKVANYLAKHFAALKPSEKAYFKANAKKYIQKNIRPINRKIASLSKKSNGKLVDVSEPVFDYALASLGYKENNTGFAKSVEDGTDPAPKDVANMQQDIRERKIAFFVQNTQATDKTVGNLVKLAKKYQVPVLKVTETKPKGKTYKQWMLSQYNQVGRIQNQAK
ncbi:metal ABC transporter solute-binding protein [Oenococcus kitaharae]|uniref:Zinc ABC transporterperiplasmic-binding protein n=1 Tax=Oenococcus kitaharae DSM 17330 TaxID=1045004 RepID=G9WG90_9LACO|nr:metal ABC transporter solute-binding protein [Oenococcus kitaharae]EHN59698.1 Zinc ABC transporterperiplasmic-binding protein [Oenococcus kitaharae DSM 17330]OEY83531.1 metal ABC transporter substrate-binding protein [Oenococcus kitaharae]OEY85330.1 metal ABC transporter substrate-binding protein [Oenococcus kitaharae]OEY86184.1 metal ABC transporter substrate-binding protein [Oenococcus kitaharae]